MNIKLAIAALALVLATSVSAEPQRSPYWCWPNNKCPHENWCYCPDNDLLYPNKPEVPPIIAEPPQRPVLPEDPKGSIVLPPEKGSNQ